MLEAGGFEVLALHDNREFRASGPAGAAIDAPDVGAMRGRKLYAFARRRPEPPLDIPAAGAR